MALGIHKATPAGIEVSDPELRATTRGFLSSGTEEEFHDIQKKIHNDKPEFVQKKHLNICS